MERALINLALIAFILLAMTWMLMGSISDYSANQAIVRTVLMSTDL